MHIVLCLCLNLLDEIMISQSKQSHQLRTRHEVRKARELKSNNLFCHFDLEFLLQDLLRNANYKLNIYGYLWICIEIS